MSFISLIVTLLEEKGTMHRDDDKFRHCFSSTGRMIIAKKNKYVSPLNKLFYNGFYKKKIVDYSYVIYLFINIFHIKFTFL